MSYNYSNPFLPPPVTPRSTFSAVGSLPSGSQVLFGGLPLDVTENDIRDLLVNEPLSLSASTTAARAIYTHSGDFTGFAIIHVGNDTDAERIRREYSGQIIDASKLGQAAVLIAFRLTVQHILPPTQPLPSAAVVRMVFPTAPVVNAPPVAPAQPKPKPPARNNDKAPGLKLLARLSGNGPAGSSKQLALLAQQKANLNGRPANGRPGAALLSRLAKPKAKPAPAAKVVRAKQAIEVQPKPRVKTQAELDEEMRAYTRQSRFA